MTFFAVLFALLLDQARRPGLEGALAAPAQGWADWVQRQLDAGHSVHGLLVWSLAWGAPVLGAALGYALLDRASGLLGFAWTLLVLYLLLGFRQFSHPFTAIRAALESGDETRARALLADWLGTTVVDWPREELLRRTLAQGVLAAQRHVFGVLVWFVVGAALGLGPAGAVAYRQAAYLAHRWAQTERAVSPVSAAVATLTQRMWYWLDAAAARVTVLVFAMVGHFEEALARWRLHAGAWHESSDTLVLAVAEGALQVRLLPRSADDPLRGAELREPQLAHMASAVGLVWRGVILWLLALAIGLLARLF
ncbi:CobD/CbiB family protein [Tepidimonas charontis]|uniref:Cobalamin biosynthesis protein CobD n=1 Tax=Tepidimonas charontis TaxID=2267262 RepID=A0A554XCR4_9BURK|nr:cobalamin biosynthesis protein CbiB [Tepidimonas charontis]TSE33642.1 hypothetical protein Tchar_01704 [Tepidimonas charontis]